MLALKTILADKDQITVLVFDEIDANIGDRLGATIGRKMRDLAHGVRPGKKSHSPRLRGDKGGAPDNAHQIICITHLSQIAACADHHLQISKDIVGPGKDLQTVAKVRVLEGEARIRELAEMMAGTAATAATLAHARSLLEQQAV
jgi:DNA repair protein RecN (Recombination protein N)